MSGAELEAELERALEGGDAARVNALLSQGAEPTPIALCRAIGTGLASCVKSLLDCGADPCAPDTYGVAPVYFAAGGGHPAVAAFLADPERTDPTSPLWPDHETQVGHGEVLWLLLDRGADPNVRYAPRGDPEAAGLTPLMIAAAFGYVSGIDVLIARGAQVDVHDWAGRTARDWAEKLKHKAAMERFRSFGR